MLGVFLLAPALSLERAAAQVPLVCGQPVAGSIDTVGEQDELTFSATAGDLVLLTLTTTGHVDLLFSAFGTLRAPSGALVDPSVIGQRTEGPLPETGTYTLTIFASDLEKRGSYAVTAEWLAPAAARCDTTAIACGQPILASITATNQIDLYTFSATVGDVVLLSLTTTTQQVPLFAAFGVLWAPSGALVDPSVVGQRTEGPLPETGSYTLAIFASGLQKTGAYAVAAEWLAPAAARCDAVAMSCGEPVPGSIDLVSELDLVTFSAAAGDVVLLTLTTTGQVDPLFTAVGTLRAPSGAVVDPIVLGSRTEGPLPETGSYTLVISANGLQKRGTYSLTAQWLTGQCQTPPMTLTLSRSQVTFGSVNDGGVLTLVTGSQSVLVEDAADNTSWTATTGGASWLTLTAGDAAMAAGAATVARTGDGSLVLSITDPGSLPFTGTLIDTVTVEAPGVLPQTLEVLLHLFPPGGSSAPVGMFDAPTDGTTGVEGSLPVTGWALDDIEVTGVQIFLETPAAPSSPMAPATLALLGDAVLVEGARPDVATANPAAPFNTRAGWGLLVLTNMLPNQGNGTFTLRAIVTDREGQTTDLGTKTFSASNAAASKPFGAIDTPAQGGLVSGSVQNFGWALTQPGKVIPLDGSTIVVFVDGVPVGNPTYGQFRQDIFDLFPGFVDNSQANGHLLLDTTTYANGTHTIAWSVTDSEGNTSGIGSRFFEILNTTSPATVGSPPPRLTTTESLRAPGDSGPRTPTPIAPPDLATLPASQTAVLVRRGYDLAAPADPVWPDTDGRYGIEGREVERLEIRLGGSPPRQPATSFYRGYLRTGEQWARLPIGSTLDPTTGVFAWQPGLGYVGAYDLDFVRWDGARPPARWSIRLTLAPKFSETSGLRVTIDAPGPAPVFQPFAVTGWALDQAATSGPGVDAVHVWAYPEPGSGADPIFLGAASYGGARPDVGAAFGQQFTASGYGFTAGGLPPGLYDLVVFPHSAVTHAFGIGQVVRIRVN